MPPTGCMDDDDGGGEGADSGQDSGESAPDTGK